jgi:alpha-beta hydrolase superfamily lysophospholipase
MLIGINRKGWAAGIRKDLPVLLISGEEDPVGAFGAGVREVYRGLKDAGLGDLTLTLYEGMRHEVLNEKDKQRACDDLLAWCDGRAGAK